MVVDKILNRSEHILALNIPCYIFNTNTLSVRYSMIYNQSNNPDERFSLRLDVVPDHWVDFDDGHTVYLNMKYYGEYDITELISGILYNIYTLDREERVFYHVIDHIKFKQEHELKKI